MSDNTISLVLLCTTIFWSSQQWGFVSFAVLTMQTAESLTLSQIAVFIPIHGLASVVAVMVLGSFPNLNHKRMMLSALSLFLVGIALIVLTPFGGMVAGFILYGIGYSVLRLVPYNQIRLIW